MRCDEVSGTMMATRCSCRALPLTEAPNDPIDLKTYDVQQRYAAFNARFFAGALPTIPIKFAQLQHVGGDVRVVILRTLKRPGMQPALVRLLGDAAYASQTLKLDTLNMRLDRRMMRTEQQTDMMLLHEMIHVWLFAVEHNYTDNHGPVFRAKAAAIGQEIGYPIPLVDKIDDLNVAPEAVKSIGVLLLQKNNGSLVYALVNLPYMQANLEAFASRYGAYVPQSDRYVGLYAIASATWTRKTAGHPVQRAFDFKLNKYHLRDKAAAEDLVRDGRVLWSTGSLDL